MRISGFWVAAVALIWSAPTTHSQQIDCGMPGSSGDPQCRGRISPSREYEHSSITAPALPVIREPEIPRRPVQAAVPGDSSRRGLEDAGGSRAPEAPTEFQRFVEQSTGQMLPIFGANLFQNVPSTFAPADRIPVTPDYPLGPGDQLVIRGWGQIELDVSPVVDRAGAIYIPQVGEVYVAGLRFSQVQDYLKSAIGHVYRNFDLSVGMGQLRSLQILVMGHAHRPGTYTVSSLSTLVNAIFASGGPDPGGSMREIQLRRAGQTVVTFDLYDLLVSGDKSNDKTLLPGDVIHFPPKGPQVALTGSLNTPAIYELKTANTIEEALRLGGGLTPVAARQRIFIERTSGASRHVLQALMESDAFGDTRLENGDIVSILPIVPRFENAVALRGNVPDPIRMPWRPGMKIRDLIPDASALVARDYWLARNAPTSAGRRQEAAGNVKGEPDAPADLQSRVMLANLRRSGSGGELPSVSAADGAPPAIGAIREAPPITRNRPERSALEVNWSYAVIERLDPRDLKTTLVPFRLGRAVLDHDESENLPLQPGDIVTIFSTSDLKVPQKLRNRYIRLEGEFESAGVYSVLPGETLRQLVKRAGGFTSQAYLFGSEFLRESCRAEQQQRLDDLVQSLERQSAASSANILGSVVSTEQAAAAAHQVSGQHEVVENLRRVRATGRIVLGLYPGASGIDSLPDLPLEDGDIFVVPSQPSFVSVVGSVYNGSSFLHQEGRRAGDYLRMAGGPTRTADRGSMFIIRADGSVVSKSWKGALLGGGFESISLYPGDSVVVPDEINKTTFLRGLKDWSTVFAQFGLGAAAVNLLR